MIRPTNLIHSIQGKSLMIFYCTNFDMFRFTWNNHHGVALKYNGVDKIKVY